MKDAISNVITELNKSDFSQQSYKVVTETIKTLFAKQGAKLGYYTTSHRNLNIHQDFEYDEGEWLFDLAWYEMKKGEDMVMISIPLVLESELSDKSLGGLKVDFDKLLVATSSAKVFVTTIQEIEVKKKYIQKAIDNFEAFNYSETLYLIIWDEIDSGKFNLEEFQKQSKKNELIP